jgi:antitoxin ParD1/3/4
MATMNISLSEQLRDYAETQVSSGKYSTVSEYMRDLIRQDWKAFEKTRIEEAVLAGLNSGEPVAMTAQAWEELRGELFAAGKAI